MRLLWASKAGRRLTRTVRLIPKELAIAEHGFCVLVDRDLNGLDMEVALALRRREATDLRQRLDEFGMVVAIHEILRALLHHFGPPKTMPFTGPGAAFLISLRPRAKCVP